MFNIIIHCLFYQVVMIELNCISGVWKLKNNNCWDFKFDVERGGSLTFINEDTCFTDLCAVVIEDFGIDVGINIVKLSYSLPSTKDMPPMYIRNDRQVQAFMKKLAEFRGGIQLCVTVEKVFYQHSIL